MLCLQVQSVPVAALGAPKAGFPSLELSLMDKHGNKCCHTRVREGPQLQCLASLRCGYMTHACITLVRSANSRHTPACPSIQAHINTHVRMYA